MGKLEEEALIEQQISDYLLPFPDHITELAQELRKHLRTEYFPTKELVADSTISVNIGYGFTNKGWDCFAAIIVYSKHINISLPSGAFLKDPDNILQGTGSRIRHIKVRSVTDLQTRAVREILTEAREKAEGVVSVEDAQSTGIETRIKQVGGPKKRPSSK